LFASEGKPHPLSEPTVTDRREVMERGSEDYCLQMKRAFRWCEERLSSMQRNALLDWRRAFKL